MSEQAKWEEAMVVDEATFIMPEQFEELRAIFAKAPKQITIVHNHPGMDYFWTTWMKRFIKEPND